MNSVVPSAHLPLLIGRDFLTPAGAVVDICETLRIGTGVDNLIVSGAGHLALQLKPRTLARRSECGDGHPSAYP